MFFGRSSTAIEFSSYSLPFGSMLSLLSMTGAVEVHSLGYYTVVFCFVRFRASGRRGRKQRLLLRCKMLIKKGFP